MIHTGAVAVMDALGFKGIWNRWDPAEVVAKFRATKSTTSHFELESLVSGPVAEQLDQQRRLRFLSDTIVVGSSITPKPGFEPIERDARTYRLLSFVDVCRVVAGLQSWFLTSASDPPLAWRGAIAWGDFTIEEEFLIGPATDEAAEAEKSAEAALVWFCPSALKELDEQLEGPLTFGFRNDVVPIVRSWEVQLKYGQRFETAVVRPYGDTKALVAGAHRAFFERRGPQPVDVHVKFQNTRTYLASTPERHDP